MPCFQLRFSILHFPIDCVGRDVPGLRFGHAVMPLIRAQSNHDISAATSPSCSVSLVSSLPRLSSLSTLDICADVDETLGVGNSSARQPSIEEVLKAMSRSSSSETLSIEALKERQRREKIGLANKGRVPWNKGKPHSAETRERIRQRTIEALKNPKIRERRFECPRVLSDEVKNKIGSSLRRVWAKRLKWKRSRTKFLNSWAESVAEAAKTGGPGQEVLCWDSFDKIKQELNQRELDLATEKEKAKELARMRGEERLVSKMSSKLEKPVRKRKSHEERRREKEEMAKVKRRLKQERRDSRRRLKLKERLSQIRQKISNNGQVCCPKGRVTSHSPAWESFDIELMKKESSEREVSLADQIRAAKNKKAGLTTTTEALSSSFTVPSFRPTQP